MTKAMLTGLSGGLILALAAAIPARAVERQPRPYVVLVGVSNYEDKQIKPRPHAEEDAKALYDLLTDKAYLGVEPDNMHLLLGTPDPKRQSEPATHDNILKALRSVAAKAKRDDLVLFAFIGEGAPLNERVCYFASDSTFKDRAKNAVASADVEHVLEKFQSQRFCVFLDADFKGFDAGKDPAPELNVQNFYQMKEYLGAEDQSAPIGRVVFLATRGLTPSLDLDKHDLFTTVLLEGLKGSADKEGYEPDGQVTVDELVDNLDKELPPLARKNGKTKEEKDQTAIVLQDESSHFVLTHNPAVTAKVEERVKKLAELTKDEKISKELEEEGQNLLSRMPKLEAFRNLRKKYQALADGSLAVEDFQKERSDILDDMKMKRSAALDFAAKIIQATQVITAEYVKEESQGELVSWGVKGLYQRLEEKIPQDVKDRLEKAKDLKEADLTILLADVREHFGKREDLDNHKDIDYTLQRMLSHLDPYTTYIDPEMLQRFKVDTSAKFTGIGIQIRKDTARDMLMVVTPIKDSPAYKAGLKAGDIITTITREVDSDNKPIDPPEIISTKGLPLSDAVKKILGIPGTKLKLTVEREGEPKPLEIALTRGMVEVETVLGVKRNTDDTWDYYIDPKEKICYVRLASFADNTSMDLAKVLDKLRKDGIKGFILDLRYNPGGLLNSAVEISDMFIDDGVIVTIRPRVGREMTYSGESAGSLLEFPMVCLINGGSASGSEIVAACLQDHHRALLIGERSYGKGSVQNLQPFEGGRLKLTTASYWRPSGRNIHRFPNSKETDEWGVTPDKVLKMTRKEREELAEAQRNQEIIPRRDVPPKEKETTSDFKDTQLEAAMEYLHGEIKTASRAPSKKAG